MVAAITLPALLMAFFNAIAAVALLAAGILGAENYRETSSISNYWLLFTLTALIGSFTLGLITVKRVGVFTTVIDPLDEPLGFTFIVLLIVTSFETLKEDVAVTVR